MTATRTTKWNSAGKSTEKGSFTFGATRSFTIPFPGYKFEKCATMLFKFFIFFMPVKFMVEFCVFFHKSGIFFLNFFDVFRKRIELGLKE